ncbi:MAG TPA: hypothetical protein VM370_04170 [Candidatus Thermoplasmatota archaeon]|nr:hypothetical protein [Candidatus Thermoplasmatota archaeon]
MRPLPSALLLFALVATSAAAVSPLAVRVDAAPPPLVAGESAPMPLAITIAAPCDAAGAWSALAVTIEALSARPDLRVETPAPWIVPFEGCDEAHALTREIGLDARDAEPGASASFVVFVNATATCDATCPYAWTGAATRLYMARVAAPAQEPPAAAAPASAPEAPPPARPSPSNANGNDEGNGRAPWLVALGAVGLVTIGGGALAMRPHSEGFPRAYDVERALAPGAWDARERDTGMDVVLLRLDARTARTLASLAHPNLPRVVATSGRFVAFERVEGAPVVAVPVRVQRAVEFLQSAGVACRAPDATLVRVGRDGIARLDAVALAA